jgi:hypothetical protein
MYRRLPFLNMLSLMALSLVDEPSLKLDAHLTPTSAQKFSAAVGRRGFGLCRFHDHPLATLLHQNE